jgi:hypothetical protein
MTNAPLWLGVVFHVALGWMILAVAKPLSVALASVDLWLLLSGDLGAVSVPWLRLANPANGCNSLRGVRARWFARVGYAGPAKGDMAL